MCRASSAMEPVNARRQCQRRQLRGDHMMAAMMEENITARKLDSRLFRSSTLYSM